MGLKDRLRRVLIRSDERIAIPQPDGSMERFTPEEMEEAFLRVVARIKGEDVAPHPASIAAARSSDPKWRASAWAYEGTAFPCEDLSEEATWD